MRDYTVWPDEDFPHTPIGKPKKHEIRKVVEQIAQGQAVSAPTYEREEGPTLQSILAQVSGRPSSAITPESRLGDDLGLDSVGCIELSVLLEEKLRTVVAEDAISDETTVRELEELVSRGDVQGRQSFARWAPRACVRDQARLA